MQQQRQQQRQPQPQPQQQETATVKKKKPPWLRWEIFWEKLKKACEEILAKFLFEANRSGGGMGTERQDAVLPAWVDTSDRQGELSSFMSRQINAGFFGRVYYDLRGSVNGGGVGSYYDDDDDDDDDDDENDDDEKDAVKAIILQDAIRLGELCGVTELAKVVAVARRTRKEGPKTDRELGLSAESDGDEVVVRYRRETMGSRRRQGGAGGGAGAEEAFSGEEYESRFYFERFELLRRSYDELDFHPDYFLQRVCAGHRYAAMALTSRTRRRSRRCRWPCSSPSSASWA